MGGGGVPAPRPVKTGKTATTRITHVKVVGTSPVRSNSCTLQLALSKAVQKTVTKTVSYRQPNRLTSGVVNMVLNVRRNLEAY